jgi:hypothetical protein
MTEAALRRWLKVNDPTALTALETLQRALGYGRAVAGVHRSEIWAFRWRDALEPVPRLARLARGTNLLLPPNKHRMEIAAGGDTLSPRGNVSVLVWTAGEGSELEETLRRHRLVTGEVPLVRRGTLWELDLAGEAAERVRLAEEIAVARERGRGLLANPHVNDVWVFEAPPTAAAVVRALTGGGTPAAHELH